MTEQEYDWYFVTSTGQHSGPHTREELLAHWRTGQIRTSTMVWAPGLPNNDWVRFDRAFPDRSPPGPPTTEPAPVRGSENQRVAHAAPEQEALASNGIQTSSLGRRERGKSFFVATVKLTLALLAVRALFAVFSQNGFKFGEALIGAVILAPVFGTLAYIVGYVTGSADRPKDPTLGPSTSGEVFPPTNLPPHAGQHAAPRVESVERITSGGFIPPQEPMSGDMKGILWIVALSALTILGIVLFQELRDGSSSYQTSYLRESSNEGTARTDEVKREALPATPEASYGQTPTTSDGVISAAIDEPSVQSSSKRQDRAIATAGNAVQVARALSADDMNEIFAQFPESITYSGEAADVVINDEADYAFRTRVRLTKNEPVNFSGEYTLSLWGCGAQCLMGVAVNKRTGSVVWMPGSICCAMIPDQEMVFFRANSSALVLVGSLNEEEPHGLHTFVLRHDAFVHVSTVPIKPMSW